MIRNHAKNIYIGLVAVFLSALPAAAQTVVRQPYLQLTTPNSVTIVWRMDVASDSRVQYGTVQGSLTQTQTNAASVTNHIVTITGLQPATKYFYQVGSTTTVHVAGTAEHYFVTAPNAGSAVPFRAWILGDSGTGTSPQLAVRDAMLAYTGATRPDMMLHMGDIAYTSGTETEFTDFHFGVYSSIFRHTVQWPTLGNHEGASTTSGQPGASSGPYYDAFVLPTAAEAGGTASGTEAYYSFDYANVHFISLNAYQVSRSASGPMATWLANDLSATNAQWVVAFWHHPPYTHGTHNSDSETELREMRQNFLPILEAGGVDLVLCGHSHDYERSYFIDGEYSTPTPDFATLQATGKILDDGDGKPTGDGAYQKASGLNPHEGTVYVVAGHGGAGTGGTLNHPVMYFSETSNGSCLLDVNGNSLTLTNVRASGVVSDTFTIQKGPQSPKVLSTTPPKSAVLASLPTIRVTFSTGVTGVDAGDLSVNGSIATSVSGASGGSVYDFSGFAPPANGHVGVVLAAGGIADAVNPGLQFTGNVWSYTIDTTPPRIATESPVRNQAVGVLPSITINFSKGVTGVVAGDLRVNGQAATSLSGVSGSTGPYTFTGFPAPATGQVSVTVQAGAIRDELLQPFAGDSWVYVLQPHLVINEYLTSNNTSAHDENNEFDDYVEIYNPANVAVDMGGMHLSDSVDFAAQYKIPTGVVIPAHGHLVFWCDSQPSQGPLHTNFNLARAGESVVLAASDEEGFAIIDSTSWVNATTDVPQGRFPDGAPGFVNMPATAGTTNTIGCTSSPQCSALNDTCNTGVCSSNRCVAQIANQGGACDDGVACRAPDTCNNGVCDGGASTCTGGQLCNLVSGVCELPQGDPLPIAVGLPWKYFKGTTAPPATWNEIAFDDSGWLTGNSGFGYGTDCTPQGTVLSDMINSYASIYTRRLFHIDNPAAIQTLIASVDIDDGYAVYINGHRVGGFNVAGTPPSNTQLATVEHECSTCGTAPCHPPDTIQIDLSVAQLVAGNNVIAVQGHNVTLGSSDFTLITTLAATEGQGCAVNPECDDNNPCTDDSCEGGTCQHANADGNSCSDGIACTNDACSSGACISTSACPVGRTCNLSNGLCESTPVTVTFQQDVGGYVDTVDTFIQSGSTTNNATFNLLTVDGVPPATDERQILIRFNNIFGSGPGQIPVGASVSSASLDVWVSNAMAQVTNFHRMLRTWNASDIWSTFGNAPWNGTQGVQADGVEARAATDAAPASVGPIDSMQSISVTPSLQAWAADPPSNFGWMLRADIADSLAFDSSEGATATRHPKLTVTYTFSPPCSVDGDCTDNNLCNGIETCNNSVCQAGTALVCNDGLVCTTDSCSPASGCVFTNNTNPCSDGDACTANDTCSGGLCVPGAAPNCDDSNVCTNDSCVPASGCAHASNTAACSDGNLCTTGDVCSGGTCSATPVSCPGGQSCNPANGQCVSGPQTLNFQQGQNGYTGVADSFIDTALGSQATATPIVADGSPVEQIVLQFSQIFGSGPNQIPAGSTISGATLTLRVGSVANDQSANPVNYHRLLHAWSDTDVWAAYGVAPWNATAGIQNDGVDALAAVEATATMSAVSTAYPVTTIVGSLQAWSNDPSSNHGWVILPTGTDGLRVESSESTTAAFRPLLSVTFTPPTSSCTTDANCNDNDACNGLETCVSFVCQSGPAPNCNDGLVCTTDSCVPATGCAHANNTNACDDGNACTTSDACSGGVCVGGAAPNCDDSNPCTNDSCVAPTGCAHVNNSAGCSDGNLCTTADVCAGGTCGGTPVSCPGGQSCNASNGQCEAATDPPLPIVVGDTWHYFKGTVEPAPPPNPPTWATIGYDDTLWLQGPSGFGYGPDCTAQRGTTLADMQNPPSTPGYFSIYVRRKFSVSNPAAMTSATVVLDYDDGGEVYINGTEVTRTASMGGTVGTPLAFNAPAAAGHECSVCDGPPCNPAQSFSITLGPGGSPFVAGTNVIAIHAHNQTLNSSDFTLIPSLSATFAACTVDGDCNDSVACTTDTCQTGTCQHTSNCLAGQTCNLGTGLCESTPVTATFRDGLNGYTDTDDTYLAQAAPTTAEGAADNFRWDLQNPDPNQEIALIKFANIIGNGAGQIPPGATISSAVLKLEVTNGSVVPEGTINESAVSWAGATATWNNFGGEAGVQTDEYLASPSYVAPIAAGSANITVTASVQAWASGLRSNEGWVIRPNSGDGVQVDSSEFATDTLRPTLTVVYVSGCANDAQCSDNNVCNGLETCAAGQCQAGTPLTCADPNPCTTDSCDTVNGCQFVNNTLACNDGHSCTTLDTCSGGTCVGTQISCDDGVACTTDTCDDVLGCQHASNCPGGASCDLPTGTCTAARMECTPSSIAAGVGSTADLSVVLRNLGGLGSVRGYQTQISIVRTSGAGTVSVDCPGGVEVDDARPDYLFFNNANDFIATNCALRRASSSLLSGGVTVPPTPAYLSGYTLSTSLDATAGSTFAISLDAAPGSSLVNPSGQAIAFDRGPACTLTIASCVSAAECDDFNPCTVDTCDLSLGCQHQVGNAGTVCRASTGQCDPAETCTGASATCPADVVSPNGTACNDGNACTQTDTCQSGTCSGSNPVLCTALDQCHDVGICAPGTGVCSNPPKANGASCDDGDACTQTDTCQSGTCSGSNPVLCTASDQCHDVGICAPETGVCSNPPKANGASCNDGDACTQTDTCQNGSCVGGAAPSCDDDNPCTTDACVSPTGCTHTPTVPCNFTADDIVVYRVGTGSGSLVNTGNPVFLDEYTPSGTLVQSIPMPTTTALPQRAFFASGTAGTEGMLSRSADKAYLVLTGYASTASGLAGTSGTVVPRVIGRVDVTKAIDTRTALTDFASGNNPRSATSDNGTRFWAAGGAGAVRYVAAVGDSTSIDLTSTSPNGSYTNVRQMAIFGGQLYASSTQGTNTFKGVSAIGTLLPTTASQPVVRLTGLTDANCPSSNTFVFADLTGAVPGFDTLYIADDTSSGTGGVQKFSLVGGTWVSNGAVEGASNGYRGLVAKVTGTTVTLYASRKGGGGATGGGELVSLVDATGYNATITATSTVIATAVTNTAFRGIAFAPEVVDRCANVVCTALDQCHQVGVCDPDTGICSNPSEPDATACNDGNACTQTDTCQSGACSGTNPVVCTASDQCHDVGVCAPATGVCSNPPKANGASCNDGNACTQTDTCQSGACSGTNPVPCNDSNTCTDDSCNTLNGACVFTPNDANSCTDSNVCTTDACSSGSCVHSASGACGISGTVLYYRNDSGAGSEPSVKGVPNVGIDRTQDALADTTTGSGGTYAFSNVSGNVTVTTVNKFGSPRASDHNDAISSLDASLAARAAALLVTLSPNQRVAGDVTGDGTVSAFDASFIARFAAQVINHFDVATTSGSDWKFFRCDAYAFPGDPGCGTPAYDFTPANQNETGKNFYAILYGDVTGNWQPAALASRTGESSLHELAPNAADQLPAALAPGAIPPTTKPPVRNGPAELSLRGGTLPMRAGEQRKLTIELGAADGIFALDLKLGYDPAQLEVVGVETAGIGTGYGLARGGAGGAYRIAAYGIVPLSGSGPVLTLTVKALTDMGGEIPLSIDGAANEGQIPLQVGGRTRRPGTTNN